MVYILSVIVTLSVKPICQTGCCFTNMDQSNHNQTSNKAQSFAVDDHHGQSLQVTSKISNSVAVVSEPISLRMDQSRP